MKWSRRIQSYGLITLIAALVWLYAEGEGVTEQTLDVMVQLPTVVGEDIVVEPADATDRISATLVIRGNASRISELRGRLGLSPRLRVPLEPDDLPEAQRGPIDLAALVARTPLDSSGGSRQTISDLGVSLMTVEPARVSVTWDRLVTREMPVRFQPEGVDLSPNLRVDPPRVLVTMPQSLVDRYAGSEDVFFVEAAVQSASLVDLPEGVSQTVIAQLELPLVLQRRHVRLAVNTAEVTFAVARKRETMQMEVVPVWLLAPPSELARFEVTLADESRVLRDVSITASRSLIERLRDTESGNLRVVARLELTGNDLERGIESAPISAIEIQELTDEGTRTIELVPVNPEATRPDGNPDAPRFSSANIAVQTATAIARFTISRKGG